MVMDKKKTICFVGVFERKTNQQFDFDIFEKNKFHLISIFSARSKPSIKEFFIPIFLERVLEGGYLRVAVSGI